MRTFTPWKQAIYMIFAGAVFSACGELPEDRIRIEKQPPQAAASRHSTQGCELDDDCEQGMHCFQSLCVTGCSTDEDRSEERRVGKEGGRRWMAREQRSKGHED